MSHHKLKTEDVAQCLISGTSNLTSDVLRQLLAFAPDDREVTMATKKFKSHQFRCRSKFISRFISRVIMLALGPYKK